MKERPILFSGPMVRAILDGRKTQTRRIYKPSEGFPCQDGEITGNPNESSTWTDWGPCRYGNNGDRLWVRETFLRFHPGMREHLDPDPESLFWETWYRTDSARLGVNPLDAGLNWRPSIFMPRAFSRILLEIVGVRVERVRDITEWDAQAEGVTVGEDRSYSHAEHGLVYRPFRDAFKTLWGSINDKRGFGWEQNPCVWVITFKRINQ